MVVLGLVGLLVLAAPATLRVRRRSARLSTDASAARADRVRLGRDPRQRRRLWRVVAGRGVAPADRPGDRRSAGRGGVGGDGPGGLVGRAVALCTILRRRRQHPAVGDDDQGRTSWIGPAAEPMAASSGPRCCPARCSAAADPSPDPVHSGRRSSRPDFIAHCSSRPCSRHARAVSEFCRIEALEQHEIWGGRAETQGPPVTPRQVPTRWPERRGSVRSRIRRGDAASAPPSCP